MHKTFLRGRMQRREFITLVGGAREVLMQKFMLIAVVGMSLSSHTVAAEVDSFRNV